MAGVVSKRPDQIERPKRLPYGSREENLREAREIFRLHRMGMPFTEAFSRARPYSKATRASKGVLGRRIYDWYVENCKEDMAEALAVYGLDKYRLAEEVEKGLNANTHKDFIETEIIEEGKTKRALTIRETRPVEDNGTRQRARELLADLHGVRRPDTQEDRSVQVLIVNANLPVKPKGSGE